MKGRNWIHTYTGRKFDFDDLSVDSVCIEDIAHHLSNLCRFNGAATRFYSVAEHSVHLSRCCPDEFGLWGLLDDAPEAYIGDVARPFQWFLGDQGQIGAYLSLQAGIMELIIEKFSLGSLRPKVVADLDDAILIDERDQVMTSPTPDDWGLRGEPLGVRIWCWSQEVAEEVFLNRYRELT